MTPPPPPIWAYSYRIVPPQAPGRLRRLKALLDKHHQQAQLAAATWEGRFVVDDRIANILVLSDSPDLDRDVNHEIEAELRALNARYSITVPLAVLEDAETPAAGSALPAEDASE